MQTVGVSTVKCADDVFITASRVFAQMFSLVRIISRRGQRMRFTVRIKVEKAGFKLSRAPQKDSPVCFPMWRLFTVRAAIKVDILHLPTIRRASVDARLGVG